METVAIWGICAKINITVRNGRQMTRIIDNDMGAVMKVPLTGRGTIHGFTMVLDFVTGQELNPTTKKMEVKKK
jgi:hypothetical protein